MITFSVKMKLKNKIKTNAILELSTQVLTLKHPIFSYNYQSFKHFPSSQYITTRSNIMF